MKTATCPSCSASRGRASPSHAGVLPGQPASHGCVRLPHAFAQRLFDLTDIGLRVIVVRDDIVPSDIAHPALFKPNPARREAALAAPPASRASGSGQAPAMTSWRRIVRDGIPPSPRLGQSTCRS